MRKTLVALVLTVMLLLGAVSPAFAAEELPFDTSLIIEKVSNPQNGAGEADGLEEGTDRHNSYAWSMRHLKDEHGDYVYIGSNRNILYSIVGGMAGDQVKTLVDLVTNGEISSEPSDGRACIVRYNNETGKTETYLDSANQEHIAALNASDVAKASGYKIAAIWGFRSSVEFDGVIYFNGSAYSTTGTALSLLMKISSNDQATPELVYCDAGGDLRASTVSEDGKTMYVGGNDNAYTYKPEGADNNAMQFIAMRTTDGENYEMIASPADFGQYCINGKFRSTGGDAWDMAHYQGKLYFSMMTTAGGVVFRGYEDPENPDANDYGWVWEEFVGADGKFDYGFGNPLNYTLTPVVFDGNLYFITFTDAMGSMLAAVTGLIQGINTGNMDTYFYGLSLIDKSMENETALFRMLPDGTVEMVMGDESDIGDPNIKFNAKIGAGFNNLPRSTTQYNWRATEFNGKLYIGTFDAYPLYKYITKLTNGDLFEMTQPEFKSQLAYLFAFVCAVAENITIEIPEELAQLIEGLKEQIFNGDDLSALLPEGITMDDINTAADLFANAAAMPLAEGEEAAEGEAAEIATLFDSLTDSLASILAGLYGEDTTAAVSALMKLFDATTPKLGELQAKIEETAASLEGEPGEKVFAMLAEAIQAIRDKIGQIDQDRVDLYIRVSDTIAANDNPGFELYCTEDGVNFEAITIDGFGDEYNYGVRNILATDDALFVGTANPYYGAQLWKLTDPNADDDNNDDGIIDDNTGGTEDTDNPPTGDNMTEAICFTIILMATASVLVIKKRRNKMI